MRKLINAPLDIVREMLEGATLLALGLALLSDENVILRSNLSDDPAARSVALISIPRAR